MTVANRMAQLSRVWKLSLLLGLLLAAACAPQTPPASPTVPPPTATATFTASPAPSATATQTSTPAPSRTPTAAPTEEPPTSTASPTATTTATATATPTATATTAPSVPSGGGDFAPTTPGRWNTSTPVDNMAGCSGTILAPYGPVIIRPNANGLGWVNTANEDYTLGRLAANLYQYTGATTRGDGIVTIAVTFTSATTFNMSRVFAPSAEPGCNHTYAQTGTFEFAVP